jgi:hypothetical protein
MPNQAGSSTGRLPAYAMALLVGAAAAADLFPLATIAGNGGLFAYPTGDLAQNLTGHLAFQAPGWHWPLLLAPALAWPHGLSIAMTDSNPLLSLLAKLLASWRGRPLNLLGVWLAACWVLQPLAAVYALRGMGGTPPAGMPGCKSWEAALAAAVLSVIFPALLFRYSHINLLGHFLLLASLGLSVRMCRHAGARRWWAGGLLLGVIVLVHPYLFVFSAVLLAAPALQSVLDRRRAAWRSVAAYLLASFLPVGLFALLSGTTGGGDIGFGFYSMNLLSPVWPQLSGLFGADLPVIDATGGQYEGFNYLGAGGLLLCALAALMLVFRRRPQTGDGRRRWTALYVVLAVLTLIALTPRIYAGHVLVLPLGLWPWNQIFSPVQASGRAFWVVGYALLLASVACLANRLSRPWLRAVLAVAVLLQWIDTGPLRDRAGSYFAGAGEQPPPVALPAGTGLLRIVPVCAGPDGLPDQLRLLAVRHGARLADMRASRLPAWFNCETALSDGLELPLANAEVRLFLPPATAAIRLDALGPNALCGQTAGRVLCSRGLGDLAAGAPPPSGPALPRIAALPVRLAGASLAPLLSFGWHEDSQGIFWSEGPRATLLFRLPAAAAGNTIRMRLSLDGVARSAGDTRPVGIGIDGAPPQIHVLDDQRDTVIVLTLAPRAQDATVRIVFDILRPIDPAARGLTAPVKRAGVRLRAVEMESLGG